MNKDARILFPTEFGPLGEKAESNAAYLAKVYNAELVLLHAFNVPAGLSRLFSDVNEDEVRKRAQKALDDYARKMRQLGVEKVTTMVRSGNKPEQIIVQAARELDAGMIIFGTKGGSGLKDSFRGSAVNYVIRNTSCPVLTIRNRPEQTGFQRIVVPIDLSTEAGEVVARAVDTALRYKADLHLFSILPVSSTDQHKLENRVKAARQFALEQGLAKVAVTSMETETKAGEACIRFADHVQADLICCLTQSADSGSTRMGTAADYITNHSQKAVLSINPQREYASPMWRSHHFT